MDILNKFEFLNDLPDLQRATQREEKRAYLNQFELTSVGEISERKSFIEFLEYKAKGYSLPWKSLHDDFLIVPHELTLISGYTNEGKSEFVDHILLECIQQGAKGFIASLELMPNELKKRILRQSTGSSDPTIDYLTAFFDYYEDKLIIKDTRGIGDIEKILEGCIALHKYFGFDVFVFDNLMMLDSAVDDYNKQFKNAQRISEFCKNYPVSAFLVAHSRKPSSNNVQKITRIEPPGIYDVHGASSVANLVDNHISIAINHLKIAAQRKQEANIDLSETEIEYLKQGDSIIKRDKKREQGNRFRKHLYFDSKFCRLKEYQNEHCKSYIPFNK